MNRSGRQGVIRILGLDPGLVRTGWGVIEIGSGRLRHIDHGVISPDPRMPMASRLLALDEGLADILKTFEPDEAAVEETFVNKNPTSTLKLGMARGIAVMAPARAGLPVGEYAANHIKSSVVGAGHASKQQVTAMVGHLLPGCRDIGSDAADALAVAICHGHHCETDRRISTRSRSPAA